MSWGGGSVLVSEHAYIESTNSCDTLNATQPVVLEKTGRISLPVIQSTQPNTTQSLGTKYKVTIA